MSDCPDNLYYSETHEWVCVEGDIATIGITDHAQSQLGDLVFVELPEVGECLQKGDDAGVVESVKTASDFYSPISGEVTEVNDRLNAQPEMVNVEPYNKGWLFKIKFNEASELDTLLNANTYKSKFIESE